MNTVLIKKINNNPVLFNVDNALDAAALEALQALKMPESMAAGIFGENARYADNTTCLITDNPDNAEFPFTVAFDASKIPVKPKRDTGILAGIGMPSTDFIEITPVLTDATYHVYNTVFTAPANGYGLITVVGIPVNMNAPGVSIAHIDDNLNQVGLGSDAILYVPTAESSEYYPKHSIQLFLPMVKGQKYAYYSQEYDRVYFKFFYAQGEL